MESASHLPHSAWLRARRTRHCTLLAVVALGLVSCAGNGAPLSEVSTANDERSSSTADILAAYEGKPLAIFFWATWCSVCKAELAQLDTVLPLLDTNRVALIAVAIDSTPADVRTIVASEKLRLPVLIDDGQLKLRFNVQGIPAMIVLDDQGKPTHFEDPQSRAIVEYLEGPRPWQSERGIASLKGIYE